VEGPHYSVGAVGPINVRPALRARACLWLDRESRVDYLEGVGSIMRSIEDMIERAKRLSGKDRRRLLNALKPRANQANGDTPRKGRASVAQPYGALLRLAGVAHVDRSDVASDKYQHLAAAYRDVRDE
jgi:hypothetical protein